jgi:hypothetical protein
VWPQCWDLQRPRGLEQRDLRNLNLGDLKKGPNGGVSPTQKKEKTNAQETIRSGQGSEEDFRRDYYTDEARTGQQLPHSVC